MSVERLQTVLQLSATGADQVIAEVNRIIQAMRKASGPGGGATPYEALPNAIRESIAAQLPKATSRMQTLAGQQEAAERTAAYTKRLEGEKKQELAAAIRSGESEDKISKLRNQAERLENSHLAAVNRESAARQRLMDAFIKMLPAVQERAAQERLGAQMAKDYVRLQQQRYVAAQKGLAAEIRAAAAIDESRIARKRADAMFAFGGDPAQIKQAQQSAAQAAKDSARLEQDLLARRRAQATEAFSQLPSTTALPRGEIDALLRKPVREPGDTDKVYRAREQLAEAQHREAAAHSRVAEAVRRAELGDGSREELRNALRRETIAHSTAGRSVTDAQRKLQIAIDNEALVHAQNTRRSLREDVITGFRGQRGASYGEQMGQALKFSIFYGTAYKLLFGLTQTLQATFAEGVAFQQGMTELAIATERPKEELEGIARDLGASATRAGFAPSQGIEIGARSLGLYGVTEADRATQDRVMRTSADIVNQMAVGSKMQPVDLQGQIAAIGQALGLGAAGQFRIADLDAYMTHKFGIGQGQTLEAVAQSASVGKAAGFSDEELFAIAADMISRTGQTPSAVGGYMAQIFSRGGEGSLVDVAKKQGIDPTQHLSEIVRQLSELYKGASGPEQAEISAAFGRGKIQNAAVALLGDYSEVLMRSTKAQDEAGGQANKQFAMRMDNIGGQLAQLQGVLRDFASELSRTGLLDFVGAGMVAFRELVEAVNGVLRLWNMLPNVIQDTIIGLGLFTAALRVSAGRSLGSAVAGRHALGTPVVAGSRVGGGFGPAAVYRPTHLATGPGAALRAGGAGLAAGGRAALGLIGPIGIAIGGLLAIGAVKNSADRMRSAQESAAEVLTKPSVGVGSTASEFQAYASELRGEAQRSREATGGFTNFITFGLANNAGIATAERLTAEAKVMEGIAKRLAAKEEATPVPSAAVFASTSGADITAGLERLEAGGATAREQLIALTDILFGTAAAADAVSEAFDPETWSKQAAVDLRKASAEAVTGFKLRPTDFPLPYNSADTGIPGAPATANLRGTDLSVAFAEAWPKDTDKRLQQGMAALGVESLLDIDPQVANQLAARVAAGMAEKTLPKEATAQAVRRLQGQINKGVAARLLALAGDVEALLSGKTPLDAESAKIATAAVESLSEERLGGMAEADFGGRTQELRSRLRTLQGVLRQSIEPIGETLEAISRARRAIAENEIGRLEALRRVAMQNARNEQQANRIGRSFLTKEINAAIKGGHTDAMVELIQAAGAGARAIVRKALEDMRRAVREALRQAMSVLETVEGYGVLRDPAAQFDPSGGLLGTGSEGDPERAKEIRRAERQALRRQRRLAELRRMDRALRQTPSGDPDSSRYTWEGMDVYNENKARQEEKEAKEEKARKDRETAAERAAAAAAAEAVRTASPIDAARADIMAAEAALAKAKDGSVAYYSALGQLYAAQHALADAQAAIPVAQAAAEAARDGGAIAAARSSITEAREAMRAARGDQAAYFAALGQLYTAQEQLAQATRDYRKNVRLLSIDMTNPLAMARADAREAARKLRQDIAAGKGPDVIAQDRVDARTAQSNVESTKFSQRLQAVQTAEELGRISHGKYINYLESEKRRLEGIKNRTFQQQQQLDEVDRLLKDAANQMDAQWNFGDIKLPTPYQMRRYIEQSVKGRDDRIANTRMEFAAATAAVSSVKGQAGQPTTTQDLKQTFTFYINGADTAMVKRTIEKYVGGAGRTRTAQPRRR